MGPKKLNGPLSLFGITRRASPDDDMVAPRESRRRGRLGLAIHDCGPPGVAAPRYRFTLRLALPLHPVDYVRHQLLLFLPLLLPVRTFDNLQ